jgi:hypothetical protein
MTTQRGWHTRKFTVHLQILIPGATHGVSLIFKVIIIIIIIIIIIDLKWLIANVKILFTLHLSLFNSTIYLAAVFVFIEF